MWLRDISQWRSHPSFSRRGMLLDTDFMCKALQSGSIMQNIPNTLKHLLQSLVQRGGSDLFLVVGLPPSIRVHGVVHRLEAECLQARDIEDSVLPALPP